MGGGYFYPPFLSTKRFLMSDSYFKMAPNILLGSQTISRLGTLASTIGTRFLVILDPAIKEAGTNDKIKQILEDSSVNYFIYDELPNNPDSTTLESVLTLARSSCTDAIIACGGEKALNLGRGIASLINETKTVCDCLDGYQPTSKSLPLILIPTAIRDTFMFYERCAIIDARNSKIGLIKTQEGIAKIVIFDPTLSTTLTKNQISSISLNVLCIAYESYFSNRSSFISDAIAEKTLELMAPTANLTDPLANLDTVDENLLECGCMASLAASLSAPGPITALAFAIHARYKISRTLISAILLPYLIEESVFNGNKLITAAKKLGVIGESCSEKDAAAMLAENIRGRIAKAGLPARLKDLSISIEQLAVAANDAVQLDFVQYYGKPTSAENLFDLIKQAY